MEGETEFALDFSRIITPKRPQQQGSKAPPPYESVRVDNPVDPRVGPKAHGTA